MKINKLAKKNKSALINAIKLTMNPEWKGPGMKHSLPNGLSITEKKFNTICS